jgi:hypothetical protein
VLGVSDENNAKYTLATFVVIFAIRLLVVLPEGCLPTLLDMYVAVRDSAITALVIYLANKGIQMTSKTTPPS